MKRDPRIVVKAGYLHQRERWEITVWKGDNHLKTTSLHWSIFPDFSGKRFEKNVENLVDELSEYGITKKQIEDAILKECRIENLAPPKYLRK